MTKKRAYTAVLSFIFAMSFGYCLLVTSYWWKNPLLVIGSLIGTHPHQTGCFGWLLFLPQNAVFENNDQIYTSGSDGIIKEGLYVGKIITDNKKDIKKRKYSVDLGFKEHQLNYVSVLKVKK